MLKWHLVLDNRPYGQGLPTCYWDALVRSTDSNRIWNAETGCSLMHMLLLKHRILPLIHRIPMMLFRSGMWLTALAIPIVEGCRSTDPSGQDHHERTRPSAKRTRTDSSNIEIGRIWESRARACVRRGSLDSALIMTDSALTCFVEADDTVGMGDSWFMKCSILDKAGRKRDAISAGWRSIALRTRLQQDTLLRLPRVLHNVGILYCMIGRPDSGLVLFERKDSLFQRHHDIPPLDLIMHQWFLNTFFLDQLDHGRALEHGLRCLRLLDEQGGRLPPPYRADGMIAAIEGNVAHSLSELGAYEEAISHAERGLRSNAALLSSLQGQERSEALGTAIRLHGALCDPLRRLHRYQDALAHSREIIQISDQLLSDRDLEACTSRTNMAITLKGMGNLQEAAAYADSAINLFDRYGLEPGYADNEEVVNLDKLFSIRGSIAAAMRDTVGFRVYFDRASDHIEKHLPLRLIQAEPSLRTRHLPLIHYGEILGERARSNYELYSITGDADHLAASVLDYDRALDSIAQLEATSDITNRSMVAGIFWDVLSDAIRAHVDAYGLDGRTEHLDRILGIMEMARNAMADKANRSWVGDLAPTQREAIAQLGRIEAKLFQLEKDPTSKADTIQRTRNDLSYRRNTLRRSNPGIFDRIYARSAPGISKVQHHLGPGMLAVEYQIGNERLHALWISADTVMVQQIDLDSLLSG